MKLRPYQEESIRAIETAWQDFDRTLLVLPTGTGKTIVFSHLAAHATAAGKRTLILAHRDELLQQAADKLHLSTGVSSDLEKAESCAVDSLFSVVVGSVQTMCRDKRLHAYAPDDFDIIIVDEAHHALSDSYQKVLAHFPAAKVLGVTATPDRGDKRNLGSYFQSLAYEYSIRDAIADGYLCKIVAQTIPIDIDLTTVRTVRGDFSEADLGDAIEPYLVAIAEEMKARVPDRKSVVFLPLIKSSKKMVECLQAIDMPAEHIDGTSKDRKEILARFAAAPSGVLCNSMLLTEGWDEPSVDCIVCLRPTKMRSLYAQIVGRGTRPATPDLMLLDFLWHTANHDLCHPAHLVAKTKEIAAAATNILMDVDQGWMDIMDADATAVETDLADREAALAKRLRDQAQKKSRLIDPISFGLSLHAEDLIDYEPMFDWEKGDPSDKQKALLEKFGIGGATSKGIAGKLIDRVMARRTAGLATPKQMNLLRKFRTPDLNTITFDQAKSEIDRIAANGWRR